MLMIQCHEKKYSDTSLSFLFVCVHLLDLTLIKLRMRKIIINENKSVYRVARAVVYQIDAFIVRDVHVIREIAAVNLHFYTGLMRRMGASIIIIIKNTLHQHTNTIHNVKSVLCLQIAVTVRDQVRRAREIDPIMMILSIV